MASKRFSEEYDIEQDAKQMKANWQHVKDHPGQMLLEGLGMLILAALFFALCCVM